MLDFLDVYDIMKEKEVHMAEDDREGEIEMREAYEEMRDNAGFMRVLKARCRRDECDCEERGHPHLVPRE
jgi:hypothetical protein